MIGLIGEREDLLGKGREQFKVILLSVSFVIPLYSPILNFLFFVRREWTYNTVNPGPFFVLCL